MMFFLFRSVACIALVIYALPDNRDAGGTLRHSVGEARHMIGGRLIDWCGAEPSRCAGAVAIAFPAPGSKAGSPRRSQNTLAHGDLSTPWWGTGRT